MTIRIKTIKNGPFEVKGPIELVDAKNQTFTLNEEEIYLCRCGQSKNKPFCDGSHTAGGFQAEEPAR